jgi:hypothetical protein
MDDPNKPVEPQVPTPTPQPDPVEPSTPPAQEPPASTPTPEPTPQAPAQAIDVDAITQKAQQSVIDKIAQGLGITKEEAKKQLPQDPDEMAKFVQENAKKGAEDFYNEKQQAEKAAEEAEIKRTQEGAGAFRNLWANQFNQLAEAGKVPKIVNPQDQNDPGVVAKRQLLTRMKVILDENAAAGVEYVPTLKEIFYEHPDVFETATTTGANVPVSGGGRVMAQSGALPYDQLHKASEEDLVRQKHGV